MIMPDVRARSIDLEGRVGNNISTGKRPITSRFSCDSPQVAAARSVRVKMGELCRLLSGVAPMSLPINITGLSISPGGVKVMSDRLVYSGWWTAIMLLIAFTGVASLVMAYRGVFQIFAGAWQVGGGSLAASIPMACASYLLARHRGDLIWR